MLLIQGESYLKISCVHIWKTRSTSRYSYKWSTIVVVTNKYYFDGDIPFPPLFFGLQKQNLKKRSKLKSNQWKLNVGKRAVSRGSQCNLPPIKGLFSPDKIFRAITSNLWTHVWSIKCRQKENQLHSSLRNCETNLLYIISP